MRVAHFMYDHRGNPWLGGGGAVREWEINRRLVACGHDVHVFCGSIPGRKDTDWEEDGVIYHGCGYGPNYVVSRFSYNCFARKRWRKLQRKKHFDLIVEDTSPFTILSNPRNYGIPSIAIVQNFMGKRLVTKMGPVGWFFAAHERSLQKRYRHYITVSRFLRDAVKEMQPEADVETVHNGIETAAFSVKEKRIPGRMIFLGRIDKYQKGLDILLSAFDKMVSERPDVTLEIAGGGKDEKWLRQEIQSRGNNRIFFSGRLGPERFGRIARSELFIMPSRFEGWGITAVEAAACGTPVVGTLVDGLKEAVVEGVTGVLVPPDAEAVYRAAAELLSNSQLCKKMASAGREYARSFEWDRLSGLQEAMYRTCIESC